MLLCCCRPVSGSGITYILWRDCRRERDRIVDGAVADMSGEDIAVDLGLGACEAVARGCDLTAGYVRINAEYTS